MASKKENYLDRIPVINEEITYKELEEEGVIELTIENKGFFHTIAQKAAKKPRYSYIKLDAHGSAVWRLINGERSIYEIGVQLKEVDEEAGNQLYERLAQYIAILESNHYVYFKK